MTTLLAASAAGLFLGFRHAFEPDHLAAVGSMVPSNAGPKRAAIVGAVWGSGHAAGLFVLGAIILASQLAMPAKIESLLEAFVGLMLIVLGAKAILRVKSGSTHGHKILKRRPFKVGLAHGVAGTGAAVLLATASISDQRLGFVFLALFGLGAAIGMATISSVLGFPSRHSTLGKIIRNWMPQVMGGMSIAVGLWWTYSALI